MKYGRMTAGQWTLLPLLVFALAACSPEEPAPRGQSAPAPVTTVSGRMRVADRQGNGLSAMVPIATHEPNAFDEPIATGPPTNDRGESRIAFPGDVHLYLRAWDPKLNYFPNNFYHVLPDTGNVADEMVIEMVRAATLIMALHRPDGRALAAENVALMMIHPTRGPWWPAETDTTADGVAAFSHIPPGSFTLRLKTESSGVLEIPEVALPPGDTIDLGLQTLPPAT